MTVAAIAEKYAGSRTPVDPDELAEVYRELRREYVLVDITYKRGSLPTRAEPKTHRASTAAPTVVDSWVPVFRSCTKATVAIGFAGLMLLTIGVLQPGSYLAIGLGLIGLYLAGVAFLVGIYELRTSSGRFVFDKSKSALGIVLLLGLVITTLIALVERTV